MRKRQTGGIINRTGYLKGAPTANNPVNIIPSGHITTQGMAGPISANGIVLHPNTGDYHFDTPYVVEKKLKWGGKTITTPQYLSIYPNDQNTLQPMKKSLRGKMKSGGPHFDPQVNNYLSGMYGFGGNTAEIQEDWMDWLYDNQDYKRGGIMQQGGRPPISTTGYQIPSPNLPFTGGHLLQPSYNFLPPSSSADSAQYRQGFYGAVDRERRKDLRPRSEPVFHYDPTFGSGNRNDPNLYQPGHSNPYNQGVSEAYMNTNPSQINYKSGGKHWIQHAINPAHKGYCTPMSKSTCTGHRRALALMFKKKHGFHKHEDGGYLQGMEMQQGGDTVGYQRVPPVPQYRFSNLREHDGFDSSAYRSNFNSMLSGDPFALQSHSDYKKYGMSLPYPSGDPRNQTMYDYQYSMQNAYDDALVPQGYNKPLLLPPDTKRPKKLRGGKFQAGGFQAAGSLIDQNQWAIGDGSATPTVSLAGNYYKTDPSQQTPYGATIPGNQRPATRQVNSFGTPNIRNLSMLLPLNAGLGALSQVNQYRQNQDYRTNNMNNPLSILERDDNRPEESRYGYNTFQGGGETMPFTRRRLQLWQQGGTARPTTSDSLALYNNAKQLANYYGRNPEYRMTDRQPIDSFSSDVRGANDQTAKDFSKLYTMGIERFTENGSRMVKPEEYRKDIDPNRYYQRELYNQVLDMRAPMTLFDDRIKPQFTSNYTNFAPGNLNGDKVSLYQYDTLAVKPWNMLTPDERQQRIQKYGNPVLQVPNKSPVPPSYVPPVAKRSQVQGPQQLTEPGQITPPMGGPGPLAGSPTNFSFTGRDNQGQQATRYFPDLSSWQNATDQMGYSWRNITNNGNQANASGYQFQFGGAATKLRPYMLRKGAYKRGGFFQDGGSLMDQWDIEDAQDQQPQATPETIPQQQEPIENTDFHKRADLSNEEEYNTALQVAIQSNPEEYAPYRSRFDDTDFSGVQGLPPSNPYLNNNPVSLSGNKSAYNYLIAKGISPIAASGIIGNLAQESDLKPTARDGTGAYGAAQWMGSRLSGLHQFATANNRNASDLPTQLDYLIKEAQERGDLQKLQNANSPEEAAILFGRSYERPAERTANWARRQREARNVYQP